jgi:hypothetical protein
MRQVISFLLFLVLMGCEQAKDLFVKQDPESQTQEVTALKNFFVKSPEIEEEEPCYSEHEEYSGCKCCEQEF